MMNVLLTLVIAATALNGIVVGASLDQSIKQLPARRRIGVIAYSTYSRASNLDNGIAWYASVGVGALLLTLGAAVVALVQGVAPMSVNISRGASWRSVPIDAAA